MKKQTSKKYIRRGLILAVLLTCFLCVTDFLKYLFFEENLWNRYILHCFYEREEPIGRLWLGSSHLFCGVDPDIMNDLSGEKNFNLGTNAQSFEHSHLLLQEANKRFHPDHIYLEMYYFLHVSGNTKTYSTNRYFGLWDYMPFSVEKTVSIVKQRPGEELSAVFLPFTRFRNYFFDYARTENINNDKKEDYQNCKYEGFNFSNNGFYPSTESYPDYAISRHSGYRENTVLSEIARESLVELIEYCETEDVPLTLFSAPVTKLDLSDVKDYDQYVNEINAIADAYGLKYYDFKLCKQEYLSLQNSLHFRDCDHLSTGGAELFTPCCMT